MSAPAYNEITARGKGVSPRGAEGERASCSTGRHRTHAKQSLLSVIVAVTPGIESFRAVCATVRPVFRAAHTSMSRVDLRAGAKGKKKT
jgi:hypothetical protein